MLWEVIPNFKKKKKVPIKTHVKRFFLFWYTQNSRRDQDIDNKFCKIDYTSTLYCFEQFKLRTALT